MNMFLVADDRSLHRRPQRRLRRQRRRIPFAERAGIRLRREEASNAGRDAFAKFPTKAEVARNDLFDQRWSVWGSAFGGGSNTSRQRGARVRTPRPRALSALPRAPTTGSRATRWRALRSPAAALISASHGFGSGRSDLFQAGAFVRHTIGRCVCHRRRGLWLAGRHHRSHRHGGRHRPPARPVQRQRLFRPHRRRLPLS